MTLIGACEKKKEVADHRLGPVCTLNSKLKNKKQKKKESKIKLQKKPKKRLWVSVQLWSEKLHSVCVALQKSRKWRCCVGLCACVCVCKGCVGVLVGGCACVCVCASERAFPQLCSATAHSDRRGGTFCTNKGNFIGGGATSERSSLTAQSDTA